MPDSTPIKKFIESLRTGQTDITKALDGIFDLGIRADITAGRDPLLTPGDFTPADLTDFKDTAGQPNHFNLLPAYAEKMMNARNVNLGEIAHIKNWPKNHKKKIREALVKALNDGRAVYFFWELYEGDFETVDIKESGSTNPIIITFMSPRKNVSLAAPDDVQVAVNP